MVIIWGYDGYMIHVMLDTATLILTLIGDRMGILW